MGILKSLGDFLFGKDPDIFDENGNVRHKLPDRKWQAWNDRLQANPDYDWHQHSGTKLGLKSSDASSPKNQTPSPKN
jgi:hypothetical protein